MDNMDNTDKVDVLPVCHFKDGCKLPDSNSIYFAYVILLLVSVVVTQGRVESIDAYKIFAIIFPILLDLVRFNRAGALVQTIKWTFITMNALLFCLCLIEMGGTIENAGPIYRVVDTSAFFPGLPIPKKLIAVLLVLNIFVPVMLGVASPTKKQIKYINIRPISA